ncbi:MAG: methionine ABC transporter permease [Opitutaceae bacterium]
MFNLLYRALGETLLMVFASGVIGYALGLPLGVWLFATRPGQFAARPHLHRVLGVIVNTGRSVPFIILLVAVLPLTRLLVGTSIGTAAAIVPLSFGAAPFVARLVEGALVEVPHSSVEAAFILGASRRQLIWRVLLPEALPGLIHAATVVLVSLVGYSAVAGVVGGGGLGDLGIRYGYQRFDAGVMLAVVALLVALVQLIQFAGDRLGRAADHR